jgi:hypothetical protein
MSKRMMSNGSPVELTTIRAGSLIAVFAIGACIDLQQDSVFDAPDSNLSAGSALAARPLFQMPFPCGEEWRLSTYAGHDDYEIDMIWRSGSSSGRPIVASFAGSVMASGFASGAGNRVRLYHGDGWQTEYYHMIATPVVSVSQHVQQGQVLGYVGSTGDSSGPHLHYAQRTNGTPSAMGTVVRSYFNGVAADITDDARANSYFEISRNCPEAVGGQQAPDGVAPDFDGDGKGDIVGTWADGTMTAYLNMGTPGRPSFANQRNIGSGWNSIARIVVVDADNDGKKDLLGVWSDGTLTAYLNLSTPGAISFGNQQNIGTDWNNLTKIAVVDADDDGKDDLVGTWVNGTMTAYLNTGTPGHPAFGNQQNIGVGWDGIAKIVVVDSDRDGKDDLVGTWVNGTMTAYLNDGTPGHPSFGNQQNIGTDWNSIAKIVVVDADRDDKDDLVATWNNGTMTAYLSIGTPGHPGFGNQQNIGTGWDGITKIVVADADGDGKDDLVGTWANGTMTAYLGVGTPGHPGFGNQQNIGTGWNGITKIATVH